MDNFQILKNKISEFKKTLLLNLLFKSGSFFLITFLSTFLFINYLEYFLYLHTLTKTVLVFAFLFSFLFFLFKQIIIPAKNYLQYDSVLSNENAAFQIGKHFPDIEDKLLNTIQLEGVDNQSLAGFSMAQRAEVFKNYDFNFAVEKHENKKFYFILIIPFILLTITSLYNSKIISEGSQRLLHFNTAYQAPIPFEIELLNGSLSAFKNEEFEISFKIKSDFVPGQVYINIDGVKRKPLKTENDNYNYKYVINQVTKKTNFSILLSGYESLPYTIQLLERPSILSSNITVRFPSYLNQKTKSLNNLTNITIPEGSAVNWLINTSNTNIVSFTIDSTTQNPEIKGDLITINKTLTKSSMYQIKLENENGTNLNNISYSINVIKDQHPTVKMKSFQDTSLYSYIILDGSIEDDYGFNKLKLKYQINGSLINSINIPINRSQTSQNYFYNWSVDSLGLKKDDKLEYYLEVWDNDGVNGSKKTVSVKYLLKLPDNEAVEEKLNKEGENLEKKLNDQLKELKKQDEKLKSLEKDIKSKKKLDWQDRKNIEKKINQQQSLREELEKLNKKYQDLNKKQDKFDNQSKSIKEKAKKLEKLMNQLLDEETKKLYAELQKLLKESKPKDQDVKELLDQVNKEDMNLEKELERALKLMKELQLEAKTEELAKKLEELAKEEKKLSEDTKNKNASKEDLQKKQEEIKDKFDKAKEDIKKLDKLNEDINDKNDEFEKNTSEEQQKADSEMDKSKDQLSKSQNKKASESQKKASEEMQKMSESLMEMMAQDGEEQAEEDLATLRAILENLVTLSFNQESLMNRFKKIKKVNPQFVEHSSEQIKIKDDSKIIEDSLLALASRNFQIESIVIDELFEMNSRIDNSLDAIRDRTLNKITVNQHFAMTSMNNLALLLADVAQQMQQQMAQKMPGQQQCNKPSKKPGGKKLSKLQSELNKKISELKKSGKQGQSQSEELAKLAAEQEALREALKEMEKEGGTKAGDKGKLEKLMEETEEDLVNKRLLDMTIARQEEIMTRLLKAEKAMRERELDDKREAEQAKRKERNTPPDFEQYLKKKEKEIELLKTVSPNYAPYYKNEIKQYFENETKKQ